MFCHWSLNLTPKRELLQCFNHEENFSKAVIVTMLMEFHETSIMIIKSSKDAGAKPEGGLGFSAVGNEIDVVDRGEIIATARSHETFDIV